MRHKDHVWDLEVADIEVGGDVHRIILSGVQSDLETTALAFREKLSTEYHALCRLLISYPYGNADMCADFLFESAHEQADYGYVIMECMGYPYYSGSNTVATIAALLEYERIPMVEGESEIMLEAPGGLVRAQYTIRDNKIESVTVNGGAAYVIADEQRVEVPGLGTVGYALVWSGAYFVMVDAAGLDIAMDAKGIPAMKTAGRAILDAVGESFDYAHQEFGRIDAPGFVHFMGAFTQTGDKQYRGRGATFGYPDTVYYCPTGTGTSARMALEHARGNFEPDATFECISAMDNVFTGQGLGTEKSGRYDALSSNIAARPFVLATTRMHIDFDNPLMQEYIALKDIAG